MSRQSIKQTTESKLRKWELVELVFKALGAGLLISSAFVIPTVPVAFGIISKLIKEFKKEPVSRRKIKRSLRVLEKRGIVSISKKGADVYVTLRKGHYEKVIRYSIKALLDSKKTAKPWSGKWYIVFFDVPEIQRTKRDGLRKFLKFIGFLQYQQSVYIFPFECKQEVNLIRKMVESGKYLKFVVAEQIEDEAIFKSYFRI